MILVNEFKIFFYRSITNIILASMKIKTILYIIYLISNFSIPLIESI